MLRDPEHYVTFEVFRGEATGGAHHPYRIPRIEGMEVLDSIHYIQAQIASALACQWTCKAARCGSCSAEINGRPRLMCNTRVDEFSGRTIVVRPMKAFPLVKHLVTDVSWNFRVN